MERNDKRLVAVVVTLLAGMLCGALLVIAFLLGRISATQAEMPRASVSKAETRFPVSEAAPPLPASSSPKASPVEANHGSEGGAVPFSAPAPDPPPQLILESRSAANPSTAAAPTTPSRLAPSSDRSVIATYFAQIDDLDEVGGGDPQAFATSLLQSASSGDFSGFDNLMARARSQRERLRSLQPPRACIGYHRMALDLSGDSVALLEKLRAGISGGDVKALMSMASEGQTMEARANQLKSMGEAIKRQAGL